MADGTTQGRESVFAKTPNVKNKSKWIPASTGTTKREVRKKEKHTTTRLLESATPDYNEHHACACRGSISHRQGSPRRRRDRQPPADARAPACCASSPPASTPGRRSGLRVLRKVEAVVREEMNRAGAIELLMPTIQPKELWEETGRWEKFGGQLLKIKDRKEAEYCYGPTHEEVITDFARNELRSYKQLPVNFYQIQTKFRDEIRPRFGVMRAREFLMKDAYSFHLDEASLRREYRNMYDAYSAHLHAPRPAVPRGAGRHRRDRRQRVARVPRAGRFGRGRDRVLRRLATTPPTSRLAEAARARRRAPRAGERAAQASTRRRRKPCEDVAALLGVAAQRMREDRSLVRRQRRRCVALVRARRPRGQRGQGCASSPGLPAIPRSPTEARDRRRTRHASRASSVRSGCRESIPVIVDRSAAALADFVVRRQRATASHCAGVELGPRPARSTQRRRHPQGRRGRRLARRQGHAAASRAASKSATCSSSAASTPKRWARPCSTTPARPP